MPRVILHIGFEKTGTTSIQRFLTANHETLLAQHGVLYPLHPSLCRDDAHSTLTAGLLPASVCDFVSPEARPSLTDIMDALDTAMEQGPEVLVLSSEHLSSRMDEAAIGQLAQLLCRHPVEILVYARRQAEMGISAFSTHLKCGRRDWLIPKEISPKNHYYDLAGKLAPWAEVFGRSSIRLRIYDPAQLHQGDIVDDVLAVLGIQDTGGLTRTAPLNTSLNLAEAALLHQLNQCVPTWEEAIAQDRPQDYHEAHQVRLNVLEEGRSIPVIREAPPLSSLLTDWDLMRVGGRFRKTNAHIAREYLGRDRLFPDPVDPNRRPSRRFIRPKPPLDARQLAEILLALTERLSDPSGPALRARLRSRLERLLRDDARRPLTSDHRAGSQRRAVPEADSSGRGSPAARPSMPATPHLGPPT